MGHKQPLNTVTGKDFKKIFDLFRRLGAVRLALKTCLKLFQILTIKI